MSHEAMNLASYRCPSLTRACALVLFLLAALLFCSAGSVQAEPQEENGKLSVKERVMALDAGYYAERYGIAKDKAAIVQKYMRDLVSHPGFMSYIADREKKAQNGQDGDKGHEGVAAAGGELYRAGLRRMPLQDLRVCAQTNILLGGLMTAGDYRKFQMGGQTAAGGQPAADPARLIYQKSDAPSLKAYLDHCLRVITAELDGRPAPVRLTREEANRAGEAQRDAYTQSVKSSSPADRDRLKNAFLHMDTASDMDWRDVVVLFYAAMLSLPDKEQELVLRYFLTDADE